MNIIPKKLREVGCTSTASPTPYNGEIIYKQADVYYPTFANGYKAARCSSMDEAYKWIDDNRYAHDLDDTSWDEWKGRIDRTYFN